MNEETQGTDDTPIFASTASKPTEAPAEPGIEETFLSNLRPSFWD